ncbi:MAG: alpha/beta fold hydrolase [Gammaproteobacteria bacterium]|jgi:pimeloyl-ACP methyl ester carboxylesterase|nr:alpha/beta fold hydrolase [Gammaproteobacteria bacterium]MBT5602266.1 alpha/beta fold hydrolase [Gammaproteobacteria bacterium]MBT6245422.1 alpha/beta fold hydrolase [Gammaproteobacteria bacterium]
MRLSKVIEVDGARLNIVIEGKNKAKPVLLWHGAACNLKMWDQVTSRLKNDFQFIGFDIRGVGSSVPTDNKDQYNFECYARDASIILDTLGIDQCHVWSMAWGSRAALAFCSLYPDRVSSAAFYDASIGPADVKAQKIGHQTALARQKKAGIERFDLPEDWNKHQNDETMRQAMAAAASFNLPAAALKLSLPVLVATGDCDPNLVSSRELVSIIDSARLEIMKNVGHGSVLQRPDLAAAIFADFQASLIQQHTQTDL